MSSPLLASQRSEEGYWKDVTVRAISGLLDFADTYTPEEKSRHLAFVRDSVCGWMGQRKADNSQATTVLDVASPLEASINLSSKGDTAVRFCFEPLVATKQGRTEDDPFGQKKVQDMLKAASSQVSGADLRWSLQMLQLLCPTGKDEVAQVEAEESQMGPPLDHALIFSLAFELHGSRKHIKSYFSPMAKSLATGRDGETLTFEAIRQMEPYGKRLEPAVGVLENFVKSSHVPIKFKLIGMDATDPIEARIKIYAHIDRNNWSAIQEVCTLAGIANDTARLHGLNQLRAIWHLLLDQTEPVVEGKGLPDSKPTLENNHLLGSIGFGFELRQSCEFPDVKVYVYPAQYAPSDGQIADNLSKVFAKIGWNDAARTYRSKLQTCFPGVDIDKGPALLHSLISFAYSEKQGLYMSVYYAVSGRAVTIDEATK